MNWGVVVTESLVIGAAMSAALATLIIVSLMINKEMWLQDYPPDVKARWGPMSRKARLQRFLFAIPLFAIFAAAAIYAVARLEYMLGTQPTFLSVFVSITIVFVIFNIVDAVILDFLILMVLWPGLGVLPGTEGMAGYRDARFWTVNLVKGFAFAPLAGLIAAGASSLIHLA